MRRLIPFHHVRRNLPLRKLPHAPPQLLLFLAKSEVHVVSCAAIPFDYFSLICSAKLQLIALFYTMPVSRPTGLCLAFVLSVLSAGPDLAVKCCYLGPRPLRQQYNLSQSRQRTFHCPSIHITVRHKTYRILLRIQCPNVFFPQRIAKLYRRLPCPL